MKEWKSLTTPKFNKRSLRRKKTKVGNVAAKTWATTKTTTDVSIKLTTKDATTHSPSLIPSSTTTTKYISHMLNPTPTPTWLKTSARSNRGSSITSPETPSAEPLLVTSASTSPSPTGCHLRSTRRKKAWSLALGSTQESPMPHGWWKEWLISWSAAIPRQ